MNVSALAIARDAFLEAASVAEPLKLAREISIERVRQGMSVAWIGATRSTSKVWHVWLAEVEAELVDDAPPRTKRPQPRRPPTFTWRQFVDGYVRRDRHRQNRPWTSATLTKHISAAIAVLDPEVVRASWPTAKGWMAARPARARAAARRAG